VTGNGDGVLAGVRRAVVIVTVAIGDVFAVDVVEFDLESVTDLARIIHGIEVVDGAVGDAGARDAPARRESAECKQHTKPTRDLVILVR